MKLSLKSAVKGKEPLFNLGNTYECQKKLLTLSLDNVIVEQKYLTSK